uniref:Chitinase 11 n=1 Tax=Chilo suppressalis TaxID=168631 RepID=A0A0S2MTY6_CHISP|nr:chitinase 11 [Chilo suppressalis]
MKGVLLVALLCALSVVHTKKTVVCFYGSWAAHRTGQGRFTVNNLDPHLCTHLVYAFSGINAQGMVVSIDPKLDLAEDNGADNYRQFNELKKKNTELKTLLAVGGFNEGSAKFSRMAASPALRKNFIESAIVTINKHGFNGLDVSWLYPNQRDSPNHQADVDNFSALLKEMRVYFDQRGLLLTIAVSAAPKVATKSYNVAALAQYVHLVNLMAHDLHGPWDPFTNHNAALHKGEGEQNVAKEDLLTDEAAVEYWLSKGCPPEKLVLGLPFFGHTYKLRYARINGVNAPATGPGIMGLHTQIPGAIAYFELCNLIGTENWLIKRDELAGVPYATKGENWMSYDDYQSIKAKVAFANKHNLAGVMAWSVEYDDFNNVCGGGKFTLLNAIHQVINEESIINNNNGTKAVL